MSLSSLIPAGGDFCVLRADVVDTLLTCRDGDSALVYLYLVRKGQAFDEREALRDLHLTRDRYDRAVHTLTNLRLVHTPNEQPVQERSAVPPRYSVSEMRAQREDDHRFASVCQTAEIVLGRPLTDSQTRTLMNAYEYLGLPADVLIDLLTYLHRSKGTVSRRDIDEQAHLWADMGIFSADAAAAFLAQREREKPLMDEMLRVLDMAGRDPAPDEYRYLSASPRRACTTVLANSAGNISTEFSKAGTKKACTRRRKLPLWNRICASLFPPNRCRIHLHRRRQPRTAVLRIGSVNGWQNSTQ